MPRWDAEACDLKPDPVTGIRVTRMTSTVMSNVNIYFEQPHGTPDGARFAYLRAQSADPRRPPGQQLCVADIDTLRVMLVDPDVETNGVATSSWSGKVVYRRANNEIVCLDLTTLEKDIVMTEWPLPADACVESVTPDMRFLVSVFQDREFMCNVVLFDLESGKWDIIMRHPESHGHVQINPVTGTEILLQRNRGMRINDLGERRYEDVDPGGAIHVVIDLDGGNERIPKIGEPYTAPSTGHATWVGDTGLISTPVQWSGGQQLYDGEENRPPHDPRHPQGNFAVADPEGHPARVFAAPEHLFVHAGVSRCGRYFVADSYGQGIPGPVAIVIGNINTGRYRTLLSDCGAQGGGPACSHPHPYLTADNRHVVFNADPTLIGHVHVAHVPEEFLVGLD